LQVDKPTFFSRFQRGLDSISNAMVTVAAAVLALMMLLATYDVLSRYLFNRPMKGTYELVGLMLIVASSWGLAFCQLKKGHISVNVLAQRSSSGIKAALSTYGYGLGLIAIGLTAWQLILQTINYIQSYDTSVSETLEWPLFPFMMALAIGMTVLAVVLLVDFLKSTRLINNRQAIQSLSILVVGTIILCWALFFGFEIDRTVAGMVSFFLLLILLFMGIPVGYVLILTGFSGFVWVAGFEPAWVNLAIVSFENTNSFEFAVIPLFLLMSAFIGNSGIGSQAYNAARAWIGHVTGGLAMATVGACGLFAACTGSSFAGAVAMGKVAYPEMQKANYDSKLALGTIAAGGTLGILIPPSMGFVLIGILTEVSIGKLFIAGILPGLLEIIFYMLTIYFICRFNPKLGPAVPKYDFKRKLKATSQIWPVILLFLVIMTGIYGGIFTPTEAGGIGAFGALVIGIALRRLPRKVIFESLIETAKTASMIILMVVGAFIFMRFLAITRIPFEASEYIVGLGLPKYLILTIVIVAYIVMGMFFDIFSMLILTVPLVFPMVMALGFDPIWYGVIMVKVAEIGCITPPFGINLFGLSAAVDAPMGVMYKSIYPFFFAQIINVLILIAFPTICTFLPSLM